MVGGLDFGALPPEVNSGLMYAGVGSGPMTAAATTLSELANELDTAAGAITSILSGLTSSTWQGPAATAMAAAAAPYTAWMRTTASHTAHAAGRAAAAAAAYQTAFAAMVPPSVIAANRAQHAALVATNQLGQNTAAIAAADAAYSTMWAQDVAAMYNYANESAAATALNPLTTAPAITTPASATNQTGSATSPLSALTNALGTNIMAPGSGTSTSGLAGLLNMLSDSTPNPFGNALNANIGQAFFAGQPWSPIYVSEAAGQLAGFGTIVSRIMGPLSAVHGISALGPVASTTAFSAPDLTGLGGLSTSTLAGTPVNGAQPSASVGKATLVGALSAPHSWTAATSVSAIGPTGPISSPAVQSPGVGVGPTALPGMPMRGAVRGKNRFARRYGFRPTVMAHPPTGG